MIICQKCDYLFPAHGPAGAERICESLCRGFVKLGHKVYLCCKKGSTTDTGAIIVNNIPEDTEIIHHHGFDTNKLQEYKSWGKPWVSTTHGGAMEPLEKMKDFMAHPNNICVSKFVADRLNCKAFVHNCSSEESFIYETQKQNYFLSMASFGWGWQKGLDIFISLARKIKKYDFYIAGASNTEFANMIKDMCKNDNNIKFIGEINRKEKAQYIAKAKALIIPTHLADACPTTVSEALISGTPVIGSINGSLPELVNPSIGFVCKNEIEYIKAIMNIGKINPETCRQYALENYSDIAACKKHLTYYTKMLKTKSLL